MDMFSMIQMLASMGLLTNDAAMEYVRLGTITADQYNVLMGKEYTAPVA